MRTKILLLITFVFITKSTVAQDVIEAPLKVGVIGLTHTHVHWIFGSEPRGDIKIVGIVEPNKDLASRYAAQHNFSMDLVYDSMEEMLNKTRPEAVAAFGTIYEHLEVEV